MRAMLILGATVIAVACCAVPATAIASAVTVAPTVVTGSGVAGVWTVPRPIPGSFSPHTLSCGGPLDCVVAGTVINAPGSFDYAGVAEQVNGRWLRPVSFSGGFGPGALTTAVCASPGNCTTAGSISIGPDGDHFQYEGFAISERNGTWTRHDLGVWDGTNYDGGPLVALSCPAPGDCVASGEHTVTDAYSGPLTMGGFIAEEKHGSWSAARPLRGTPVIEPQSGDFAVVDRVSCSSAGNCVAHEWEGTGWYYNTPGQQYLGTEVNGRWHAAWHVPGSVPLLRLLACPAAGQCLAAGGNKVLMQHGGTWGTPMVIPGRQVNIEALTCWMPASCVIGGNIQTGATGPSRAFVAVLRHGHWTKPELVPRTAAASSGGNASVVTLSCPSASYCAAGGYYTGPKGAQYGFVSDWLQGRWQRAILEHAGPVTVISCRSATACGALAGNDVMNRVAA